MDYSQFNKISFHSSQGLTIGIWVVGFLLLGINYVLFIHLPHDMNYLYDTYDLDFYERVLSMFAVLFSIWLIIQSIKWVMKKIISRSCMSAMVFSAFMLMLIPYQLYHAQQTLCRMECGPYPPAPSLQNHMQPD